MNKKPNDFCGPPISQEMAIAKFVYNRNIPVNLRQKLSAREDAVYNYRTNFDPPMTHEKIAELLGCSMGSVWNYICQCRKKGWKI